MPTLVTSVQPFDRVQVNYLATGEATLTWSLQRHFLGQTPHTFQVQIGETGLTSDADWADIGTPVIDNFYKVVTQRSWYGKFQTTHFRVSLLTSDDFLYYSEPAKVLGDLSVRDWLLAQEILRKEKLRHTALTSIDGYLLKRKRTGTDCTDCTDTYTKEVKDTKCLTCYGTGLVGGYYEPMASSFADLSVHQSKEDIQSQGVGMVKPVILKGRFIANPQLARLDIWANKTSDKRYEVHSIGIASQIRGVPLIYDVELRLLPPDNVIYQLDVTP